MLQKSCRYIPILLLIFFIMLTYGCSKSENIANAQIPTKFESDFCASLSGLEISGHISKLDTGIYKLMFTSPKSLDGLEISRTGDKTSCFLNGIGFEANDEAMPTAGFVQSLTSSLDTVSKSAGVDISKSDGYIRYSVSTNNTEFYILQDPSSEAIVSLIIESTGTSINFNNFTTAQEKATS